MGVRALRGRRLYKKAFRRMIPRKWLLEHRIVDNGTYDMMSQPKNIIISSILEVKLHMDKAREQSLFSFFLPNIAHCKHP